MTSTKRQADISFDRSAFFDCNVHLLIWVCVYVSKHFFSNKNTIIIVYITFYEEKINSFLFLFNFCSLFMSVIIIKMSRFTYVQVA